MAKHYFENQNKYSVVVPIYSNGSVTVPKDHFVLGYSGSSFLFTRSAVLGVLTDVGETKPAAVSGDDSLVVFEEPDVVPGTPNDAPGGAADGGAISGYYPDHLWLFVDPASSGITITQGVSGVKFVVTATSGYSGFSGFSGISGYSGSGISGYSGYSGTL